MESKKTTSKFRLARKKSNNFENHLKDDEKPFNIISKYLR